MGPNHRQRGRQDRHRRQKKRGINQYLGTNDNHTLPYLQDNEGDGNFHVYGVDLDAGSVRGFTPIQSVAAQPVALNKDFPHEAPVQMNARDRRLFDVYRLNLDTGALVLDTRNPGVSGDRVPGSSVVARVIGQPLATAK